MKGFMIFKDKDGNSMMLAKDQFVGIIEPGLLSGNPNAHPIIWATSPSHIPFANVTQEELQKIKKQLGEEYAFTTR